MALTVLACLACAGLYLAVATRVYSASATVVVQQNAPKAFSENQGFVAASETYLQTQADMMRSAPVIGRALDEVHYQSMQTFAKVNDPISWLRKGNAGFKVDVPRKSDSVLITMESAYPPEAVAFVDALVKSYIQEQAEQKRSTGAEMVRVLLKEKAELLAERAADVEAMIKYKRDNGVLSFKEDKNNTALERMTSLSTTQTAAEIVLIELKAQERAVREALASPTTISQFVTALQSKGRDSSNGEYEELKRQLIQTGLALSSSAPMVGTNHPRFQVLQAALEALKQRIAEKERAIAESQLALVSAQRQVAEEKVRELKTAVKGSEDRALELTPAAAAFAKLENEVDRINKKVELLDGRIAEVSVNNIKSGAMNVQVLEPARLGDTPVKPNKMLVMLAAMMMGWVLGIGLAMLRDWQDARLHSPDEIISVLGTPVVAMVPRINKRLSPVTRGQMVRFDARSAVAEAYRSVRTTLHLGLSSKAKTILLASPMEGDGKSTTVSNLGIAFANAGERTLIVDCDLREPVQHLIFENDGRVGLTSVIAGEARLAEAIAPTRVPGLYLLPCGPVPLNPSELLTSKKFAQLMRALGGSFDRIVIDSPPLMLFTDAAVLAAAADATLLVLRMNQSMRGLGTLALDGLTKVGANVLGAVANDVSPGKGYRKYGGAWQYASRAERYSGEVAAVSAAGSRNGEARGNGAREAGRVEVLSISEPDWSADVR